MTPPRNIIRIDHEASRTHAWRVTLQRCNDIIAKTFSDSIHGGKRKALKTAVEYRDELLRHYSPFAHAIWVRTRLRRNNTSGIPGVARYEERTNRNTGRTREFWLAFWVRPVVSASSLFLAMENATPSALPSQSVSVSFTLYVPPKQAPEQKAPEVESIMCFQS